MASRQPIARGGAVSGSFRHVFWLAAGGLLCLWVAARLDLFTVWTSVIGVDGRAQRLAETFATVDHPFHAARAEVLRRSLLDGDLLRWIANHQGGYPAEFYPLGVAWLEVAVWAISFGAWPIAYVHKLVVVAIFLLPGLAFWLLARRDGLSPAVALAGLIAHVAVPGGWWHGGYTELVQWGLVTNVAAAVALLFVLWGLMVYVQSGNRVGAVIAVLAAAFAITTNPRSLIGLATVGFGVLLACLNHRDATSPPTRDVLRRLATVAVLSAAFAAPELISLIRFTDLYYFVRYTWYHSLGDYVSNSFGAVSPPVAIAGIVGVVLALWLPRRPATRAAAYTLVLYTGVTALLSVGPQDGGIFEQLEATRLMPFQRYLVMYCAAFGLFVAVGALNRRRAILADAAVVGAALLLLLAYVRPFGPIRADREGLFPVQSAATPEQADFLDAVALADSVAPTGQALLVLGSTLGGEYQGHQQLWAPYKTDRPLFYDNWLWYWHTDHVGPYDYRTGHAYPPGRIAETLDRDYLDRHGIAAVVITGESLKQSATRESYLTRVRTGVFDVYLVTDPAPIVTFEDGFFAMVEVQVANQRILATGSSEGGTATIARNWFPRWRATANGQSVPVTRQDDGYMSVSAPPGAVTIELRYVVDRWNWMARALSMLAVVGLILLAWPKSRPHLRAWLGQQ